MKPSSLVRAIVLISMLVALCSAGISGMYVQKKGEKGWMFHVFSQKMPATSDNRTSSKSINYDFTYVEQADSVSLLATILYSVAAKPDTVTISFGDSAYCFLPELIYAKPKGKNMEYRLKTVLPFGIWDGMYSQQMPFTISFCFKSADKASITTYGFPRKKWKAKRDKMAAILEQIKLNTGKL